MNNANADNPVPPPAGQSKAADRVQTRFAYPRGATTRGLRWSRKGRKLNDAMREYATPRLLPKSTVEQMQPGSLIVDLAAETGGNCELTEAGKYYKEHNYSLEGYKASEASK
jgi:hypothetical protein